jgi:uncharacterized membrane protein
MIRIGLMITTMTYIIIGSYIKINNNIELYPETYTSQNLILVVLIIFGFAIVGITLLVSTILIDKLLERFISGNN